MSRNPRRVGIGTTILVTLLILLMIAASGLLVWKCIEMADQPAPEASAATRATLPAATATAAAETTAAPTTEPDPVPEHVVSTATIASMGDLLMHLPVINTCYIDGEYDFSSIFQYVKDTVSGYDLAAVNLETTFGGSDSPYQGNPLFNCPDSLADAIVDAGYDVLLTANNHCGDTKAEGVIRTLEVAQAAGLTTVGTQSSAEEKDYTIVEVNGIKIGMLCYTYATGVTSDGRPSLNGNSALTQAGIVNYFMQNDLPSFYADVEEQLAALRADGAEAVVLYIHWGIEYQLQENATQDEIAQKLCDLGVDVIVGGHPHVVEPVALLESSVDSSHKTVCLYSMGNAVSNQRQGVSDLFTGGYTEDGAMFTITFEKYSDGKVYLAEADVVPTWVNMHSNNGSREYNILPLTDENREEWQSLYNLTDANLSSAESSYDRTMSIVGEGLEECQTYLAQTKEDREAYYYDLAWHPENYTTPETTAEAVAETAAETAEAADETSETVLDAAA